MKRITDQFKEIVKIGRNKKKRFLFDHGAVPIDRSFFNLDDSFFSKDEKFHLLKNGNIVREFVGAFAQVFRNKEAFEKFTNDVHESVSNYEIVDNYSMFFHEKTLEYFKNRVKIKNDFLTSINFKKRKNLKDSLKELEKTLSQTFKSMDYLIQEYLIENFYKIFFSVGGLISEFNESIEWDTVVFKSHKIEPILQNKITGEKYYIFFSLLEMLFEDLVDGEIKRVKIIDRLPASLIEIL